MSLSFTDRSLLFCCTRSPLYAGEADTDQRWFEHFHKIKQYTPTPKKLCSRYARWTICEFQILIYSTNISQQNAKIIFPQFFFPGLDPCRKCSQAASDDTDVRLSNVWMRSGVCHSEQCAKITTNGLQTKASVVARFLQAWLSLFLPHCTVTVSGGCDLSGRKEFHSLLRSSSSQ